MKSDLDRLMQARNMDAFIVAGDEEYSYLRDYMTNGAPITHGLVLKKQGEPAVLFANQMEVEEAKKSGLTVYSSSEMNYMDLVNKHKGDRIQTNIEYWGNCLEKIGVSSGRVGIYGIGDVGYYFEFIHALKEHYSQYEFFGETSKSLFEEAMVTKDADEIARIKDIAKRTDTVMHQIRDFIQGHQADGDKVVDTDGKPLTIGDVKRFARRALLDQELEDGGMIFAQGRDGGFPHSRGEADMALQLGQAIVFDFFPRELGGGYWHDMTRTWCIGYAPPEVQQVYDEVMETFDIAVESFGLNKSTALMQEAVLDRFEANGHPTQRSEAGTQAGYVHSLGHGIGLQIHEKPNITHVRQDETFQVGQVVTIEPGLYYPEKGYGVRIEDSFIITENGELVSITDFPKDLVLSLKG